MNHDLHIGGLPARQIAEEFGAPLYVYDAGRALAQYERLRAAFSGFPCKIKYALKANANLNLLKLLRAAGAGLDAVSIYEVKLGLKAGFAPEDVLFTPNCVSFDEIAQAVDLGVHLNIDNLTALERFGAQYGGGYPVCIRLNPHIYAGGHANIQTGHIDSKFGVSIHQLRHVLRIVEAFGLRVEGLHMHTGSDILDAEVFLMAAETLFEAAADFPDLNYIDFGSGFKVAYKPGDVVTDVEAVGARLEKRLAEFTETYGRQIAIWFEPGKFIVSEAGYYLTRVNVVKQTVSNVFAGVEGGLNHLLRPMLYDAYHQILNVSNPEGVPRVYSVVGYICETDTLGWDRQLPEVREGDILALCNAGAYAFTMSSNYNLRPRPAEVVVKDGKACLARPAETMDDLLGKQIDLGW